MRLYRIGAHTETDLKAHHVRILTCEVAVRTHDILRRIAMEHELDIISGKVASDHVHMFVSYRPTQHISNIMQWLKDISSRILLSEFAHLRRHISP